jgi:hypothetical protein
MMMVKECEVNIQPEEEKSFLENKFEDYSLHPCLTGGSAISSPTDLSAYH